MNPARFCILPVYSELHPGRTIGRMQLFKHQVETLEAFREPDMDVNFNKVSEHFPGQAVETHADGSATVTARVTDTDLFEARRILLSYSLNCVVLEAPELVEEMRTIAGELYRIYCTAGE